MLPALDLWTNPKQVVQLLEHLGLQQWTSLYITREEGVEYNVYFQQNVFDITLLQDISIVTTLELTIGHTTLIV